MSLDSPWIPLRLRSSEHICRRGGTVAGEAGAASEKRPLLARSGRSCDAAIQDAARSERSAVETFTSSLAETAPTSFATYVPTYAGNAHRPLGKRVGLTQFGVNHLTLAPGSMSSRRHWHECEDEFVYVLSGSVTLRDDNGDHEMGAGDYVGFPAGAANGHHLVNRSGEPAILLMVGTRKVGEERVHYPDEADPGPFTVIRDTAGNRVP